MSGHKTIRQVKRGTVGLSMKTRLPISIFVLVEMVVATFILSTTVDLPENIASHSNGAGVPDGFMSKA